MQRLFVAIDLPVSVKEEIASIRENLSGVRWVSAEQLHLTLRFIGEVDDLSSGEIRNSLATIHCSPFQLQLSSIGHFPPRKEPRVIWAGLNADDTLLLLQKEVERALQRAGLPGETRPFAPHVTIARVKGTPPHLIRDFECRHAGFASPPFTVTIFHLFRSTFSASSVVHENIADYRLT